MKYITRRRFLAGAAAAGLARELAGAAPAGKVRVALWGTQHSHAGGKLRALLELPEYDVAGVCEPDRERRKRLQGEAPYRDLRWLTEDELLSDRSLQLIVVECSVAEAVPWGRKVLAADKHLHLEKPPSNRMAPFRELVEEARRKRLLIQVGYIWRFHEGINAALEAARKGWLGKVYTARCTINTDLNAEARKGVGVYRGGMMFELGCHLLDRIVDLWGKPGRVQGWLRQDGGISDDLADNTLAVLEYAGALAVISSSARMPNAHEHRSFELVGTDGSAWIQPLEPGTRMRLLLREARGPYRQGWQDVSFTAQRRYFGDFRDMSEALLDGRPLKFSYDHELLLHETLLRVSGEDPGQ